jgi:hypothetical protein
MKELESWADTTLWDEAISKEWDGLNDRDCFEHDLGQKRMREKRWEGVEWRMLSSAPTCVVSNTPPH